MDELKPCPFCGGTKRLTVFRWCVDDYDGDAVECACGCQVKMATWQGPRADERLVITDKGREALRSIEEINRRFNDVLSGMREILERQWLLSGLRPRGRRR